MSKKEIPGKRYCRTCKCPLTLLKLEKRRYENRFVCARCGEPKMKPLLFSSASVDAARRAVYARGARSRAEGSEKKTVTPDAAE